MSREAFMDAVARYWEAAYDEGMRRATHDTEDARAATALHDIKRGYDALAARLAEAEALLRQCQPYVTLAVDNEYDGDKELVRGVAAFLAADSASVEGEK